MKNLRMKPEEDIDSHIMKFVTLLSESILDKNLPAVVNFFGETLLAKLQVKIMNLENPPKDIDGLSYTIFIFYSSIPLSLHHRSFPSSILHLSYYLFYILSSNSLSLCSVSIFIFSTSVHYSLPPCSNFDSLPFWSLWLCESIYTFSILPCLPYYSEPCSI